MKWIVVVGKNVLNHIELKQKTYVVTHIYIYIFIYTYMCVSIVIYILTNRRLKIFWVQYIQIKLHRVLCLFTLFFFAWHCVVSLH